MKRPNLAIVIPGVLVVALVLYDYWFVFHYKTGREYAAGSGGSEAFGYILDIRQMNQYLSWLLVVVGLIINWVGAHVKDKERKMKILTPFFFSIIAAASSLIFFPVPYIDKIIDFAKWRWLFSLAAEQTAILFTISGVIAIAVWYYTTPDESEQSGPTKPSS